MPVLTLGFLAFYVLAGLVVRSVIQHSQTGSAGIHGPSGEFGSLEWTAGVALVVGAISLVVGPLLAVVGVLDPFSALDTTPVQVVGVLLASTGTIGTLWAQHAMGASWRVGVDPAERNELVTGGPFGWVRNPIFAAMLVFVAGIAACVPNWPTLAGALLVLVGIELQVRGVEEPYLVRAHGARYLEYAARTGRFLPGLGLLTGSGGDAAATPRPGRV